MGCKFRNQIIQFLHCINEQNETQEGSDVFEGLKRNQNFCQNELQTPTSFYAKGSMARECEMPCQ